MFRIAISTTTLAAAVACASPNPPTVSAADVNRAYATAQAISNLNYTHSNDLPTGNTIYRGQLGADVSGDLEGSILGDMRMSVDFAAHDVGGSVTNINLIDPDGRPNQRLDGQLALDGAEDLGRIGAVAFGDLTAVDDSGFAGDSEVLLVLDGDVYDNQGYGDAVFGTATGSGTGDIDMSIDGVFFGTAD